MKGKAMALTLEGQKMVKRGHIMGLEGKLAQAESFVAVFQRDSDTWGANDEWVQNSLASWRKVRAMAWVELEVGKLELADFEARH